LLTINSIQKCSQKIFGFCLFDKRQTNTFFLLTCLKHYNNSLFLKYAKAPLTALAVKDRVTGHNTLAALYLMDGSMHGYKRELDDKITSCANLWGIVP